MILPCYIAYNPGHLSAGSNAEEPPRKKFKQQHLPSLMQNATKAELDDVVAVFFYGTGVPLHVSRCDELVIITLEWYSLTACPACQ